MAHKLPGKSLILIVDDAPYARETLASLLTLPEYELAFASDGYEAIAMAERLLPDLVLLDVMMPGLNGFDVCQALRRHPKLSEMPIILVTALDDRDSRLQGLDAGADDFVNKPIDRAELRVRVRTVTRLNRYRRLLNQRLRFEWVVEQADDGYLILGGRREILFANASARVLLELPDTLKLPSVEPLLTLIRDHFRYEPEAIWQRWLAEGGSAPQYRLYLIRPETETAAPLWLEVSALAQADRAGLEQLVRVRDVTTQVTTQRDTWTFHAMIMHKLNTPLQTVMGGLELISPDAIGGLAMEDVALLARLARQGAQRLSGAVADILQYLRAPAVARNGDGVELDSLDALLAQIGGVIGVETQIELDPALATTRLRLSRPAVESIFSELFENARKFHPLRSPCVEVTVERGSTEEVMLSVADNGISLSPEQLNKAWLPYYQAEKNFTGEMPGMGLGLPMIATLVWEAGGRCRIRNRDEGPGVVVELELPLL